MVAAEIVIVDYGMGNLRSVQKALETVGGAARISSSPGDLSAPGMILPGVGAFGDAMERLRRNDLIAPVLDHIAQGKPFLGICLGLHLLLTESEEFGRHQGLGVIPGRVVRFSKAMKVPHMGWNTVNVVREGRLLDGIENGTYYYFVHSFYALPDREEDVAATTDYGVTFPSILARGNVYATQFHPEKSQRDGLKIYKNFLVLVRKEK